MRRPPDLPGRVHRAAPDAFRFPTGFSGSMPPSPGMEVQTTGQATRSRPVPPDLEHQCVRGVRAPPHHPMRPGTASIMAAGCRPTKPRSGWPGPCTPSPRRSFQPGLPFSERERQQAVVQRRQGLFPVGPDARPTHRYGDILGSSTRRASTTSTSSSPPFAGRAPGRSARTPIGSGSTRPFLRMSSEHLKSGAASGCRKSTGRSCCTSATVGLVQATGSTPWRRRTRAAP